MLIIVWISLLPMLCHYIMLFAKAPNELTGTKLLIKEPLKQYGRDTYFMCLFMLYNHNKGSLLFHMERDQ